MKEVLSKLSKRTWIIIVLVAVFLLVVIVLGSSSNESNGTSTTEAGMTYKLVSDDGKATGTVGTTSVTGDFINFNYAFVIEDSSIVNNGICRANDPSYCDDEEHQRLEAIKYRYGVTIAATESTDDMLATALEPIYCNGDAIKNDPSIVFFGAQTTVDFRCDGTYLSTWKPTTTFMARNGGSTTDLEALLNNLVLNLYDASDDVYLTVSSTSNSASITEKGLDYSQLTSMNLVKSYELSLEE